MENNYWQRLKAKAAQIRQDIVILNLAFRHPDTPWYAKLFVALIIGYALSPIDLIPDFIPVLGYLDDLLLLPAGIIIALKLIPLQVIAQCREAAQAEAKNPRQKSWLAATIIVLIWLLVIFAIGRKIFSGF